ncbi:hypothetical protein ZWY2020_030228 [Hordeum vulgare]|nr:hypothetical protein ZWY2020_030228 [Hordeum vulgare]
MDAMERGEHAPLLPESHGPESQEDDSLQLQVPLLKHKKRGGGGSKAPAVILCKQNLHLFVRMPGEHGVQWHSTNLVVYLETVLHGSNLASASNVATWFGTSYLTPLFGAIIADTFWGNYNTILVSLAVYLLGMMLVTFSAFVPTTTAALCAAGASCAGTTGTWALSSQTVAFMGLVADREGKASFFSWFYLCVSFGPIISGVFLVWIQQNISWGLGFGIATACILLAFAAFVLATPVYKRRCPPARRSRASARSSPPRARRSASRCPPKPDTYEVSDKIDSPQPKIAHTSDFKFRQGGRRHAVGHGGEAGGSDLVEVVHRDSGGGAQDPAPPAARLITSVVVSSAFSQMNTTFVQQGSAMDMTILSVPVPAASLASFEVICVMTWVLLYNKVIVPALRSFSSSGDGKPAARGKEISISWQLPQYFFLAGGEVFCYIAQLEFFFDEAPDTMKSMCTSLALLTIALGSYMSSFIYAIVEAFTALGDSPGWISDDLNKGHLDYFFWAMAAMCTLNFVVYSGIVKNYRLKTVIS